METVSEIQKKFLKSKLKDLELGVRFTNSIPKKMEEKTVGEFLQEFDPVDNILAGAGKKELDLFRLYLEAHAINWNNYKIKRLFKSKYFRKGAFLKINKLKSEEFNFTYSDLHRKLRNVEKAIQLELL